MEDKSLIRLNFAPGIKAKDVNYNFDLIHDWIKRERRRVGGYGLVNGFDITTDLTDYTISVSEGTMVDNEGEEHNVAGTTFSAGAPEYIRRTEKIACPDTGIIQLSERPYSPAKVSHIDYRPPETTDQPSDDEFSIYCEDLDSRVYYLQISDNTVYISKPETFKNRTLTFTYYTADDRVDAIVLYPDGTYKYQKSIISVSPSHVDITDYPEGAMLIGVIEWTLGTELSSKIYTNHRSYRKVYVDDQNQLYLNGKLYRDAQMIYFTPPDEPQENDMWYDRDNNQLMVWREYQGDYGWVAVNQVTYTTMRETKLIMPKDWPEDKQTFTFADDETNLFFVPNTHALTLIIDNMVVMDDQFDEIVSSIKGVDSSQGIGFKLKEPLDRETPVQVIVSHIVHMKPAAETFQRAAIFIDENHAVMTEANKDQIFHTEYPYVVGAQQLEAWADGIRLVPETEIVEMTDAKTTATEADKKSEKLMSQYFKIAKPLKAGQVISYRVSKYVWSYDQVAQLLGNIKETIADLQTRVTSLEKELEDTNKNFSGQIESLSKSVNSKVDTVNNKVNNIHMESFSSSMSVMNITEIKNVTTKDFILVNLIETEGSRALIKGMDYSVKDTDKGLLITLSQEYEIPGDMLYVTGFKLEV